LENHGSGVDREALREGPVNATESSAPERSGDDSSS
jgi:hypothetical protein